MEFGKIVGLYVVSCLGLGSMVDEKANAFLAEEHVFAVVKWYLQTEQAAPYDREMYLPLINSTPEPDGVWLPMLFPFLWPSADEAGRSSTPGCSQPLAPGGTGG